ncbi:MAG: hypothetical protein H0T62_12330 [Parachlamydiaceae bacterium]|nr:hypothetical protein [Parachlamydiaceae bacterium]
MNHIQKIGSYFFPSIFAPKILHGVKPSWSGIIARLTKPNVLSREECQRLDHYQFYNKVNQSPKGHYHQVYFEEHGKFTIKEFGHDNKS